MDSEDLEYRLGGACDIADIFLLVESTFISKNWNLWKLETHNRQASGCIVVHNLVFVC